jgi:outer membrane receptor protein involved in Fe transport
MINFNSSLARMISVALASMGSLALSSSAIAQEEGTAALEEVVVTAQKREQSLAEIPMSVTVLGGDLLERQQALDFGDLTTLIPGFSVVGDTPGVTRITLRGTNTGGVASTVGVYFDEVPFGSSTALANGAILSGDFDTFDLARIEVLRGPQGTLYGASSLGGVMKYVPNRPSTEVFEGAVKASLEDVEDGGMGHAVTGFVNIPVSDTFALRASAFYRYGDGFIDSIGDRPIPSLTEPGVNLIDGTIVENNINSSTSSGGRLQALFEPSDTFSINLLAMVQDIDSDDNTQQEADADTFEPLYDSPTLARYQDQFNDIAYDVYSATIDWEFAEWASLQSVTSYGEFENEFRVDSAVQSNFTGGLALSQLLSFLFGTPLSAVLPQVTSTDKFSQEFRLLSGESTSFEWLAGLYYTDEDSRIDQQIVALTAGTETPAPGFPLLADLYVDSTYEELAVFANATWFLTDQWDLSFGARQSDNDQSATQFTTGALVGDSLVVGNSSESPFTWSVSPRFQLSENASVYARVATGFRPGGPNIVPPTAPDSVPRQYDSDSLTNYEIGYKGSSADGRFALEVAAFYIDWEDIQLLTVVDNFGVNVNGGSAESKGIEFAASFYATEGLSLSLNGAYTDAELTADAGAGGVDGDPLPFVPDWSFGLSADYEWSVGSQSMAYMGATLAYIGNRPIGTEFRNADGSLRELDSYPTLNLRTGLESGRWFGEFYIRNMSNELGITSVDTTNIAYTGNVTIGMINPRTLGVTAGVKF